MNCRHLGFVGIRMSSQSYQTVDKSLLKVLGELWKRGLNLFNGFILSSGECCIVPVRIFILSRERHIRYVVVVLWGDVIFGWMIFGEKEREGSWAC
mmetsp:Transcript_99637/g.287630  ORF Transcript_99637/g.287630 Transcript_99637/m.287630 type:complete len:96 (+) Transcript_99637:448-735(+)